MKKKSKILPSPNRSKPPRFEDLNAEVFEVFCCALLEREPRIIKADLHKSARQKQYGIDVIGELENDDGITVISCKVRQRLDKDNIPNFGNEFLDHWEHYWKNRKVNKFILAVTRATNSDQREREVEHEKKRFKQLGLSYEVWNPQTLLAKVRPHRSIASQYLGDQVTEQICGKVQPAIAPLDGQQALLDANISQQITDIQKLLAGKIESQIEKARESIRRKETDSVDSILAEIVSDQVQWSTLPSSSKAAVKRLMGSRALSRVDIDTAETLCSEAESLDSNKINNLKALIALEKNGIPSALKALADAKLADEMRLRAGLYLSTSNIDDALKDLNALSAEDVDGEVLRLYTLAYLMKGDREKALSYLEKAENSYGEWYAVQKTGVIVRHHLSHSNAISFEPSAWPNPVITELVREDNNAQKNLEDGLAIVDQLLTKVKDDPQEERNLQVWRLAYLSNLKTRSQEAELYANSLLEKDQSFTGAIIWSIARGYDFDKAKIIEALENIIRSDQANVEHILCLTSLYQTENNNKKALKTLNQNKGKFDTPQFESVLSHWQTKLGATSKKPASSDENVDEQLLYHIKQAVKKDAWNALANFLKNTSKDVLAPEHIFLACLNFALNKQWTFIEPHTSTLTEKIQTAESIRIAVLSAYNNNNFQTALSILNKYLHVFQNHRLPADLRRLRTHAAITEGDFSTALKESKGLADETNNKDDRINHIQGLISAGDMRSAAPYIMDSLKKGELTSPSALNLSVLTEYIDPSLSRQLIEEVNIAGLSDESVGSYWGHINKLNIKTDTNPLFGRIDNILKEKPHLIRTVSQEELIEMMDRMEEKHKNFDEQYCYGNIPFHFASQFLHTGLPGLIFGNFSDECFPSKSKLLSRFGGRKVNSEIKLKDSDIHLDITAYLLAYKLDILEAVEKCGARIFVSLHLPLALVQTENDISSRQAVWINDFTKCREYLAEKIKSGTYKTFAHSSMTEESKSINWPNGESEACVFDLVRLKEKKGRIIWADDRYVNHYQHINNNSIVDIYDILNTLLAQKNIDDHQFFNCLSKLRQANYYYIPLTEREIIYQLKAANTQFNQIIETTDLIALRQYAAMIALQEKFLFCDAATMEAYDEKQILFSTLLLAKNTIQDIWCDSDISLDKKKYASAWVWDSLRIERLSRVPLNQPTEKGAEQVYTIILASLLVNSIQIQAQSGHATEYLEWLDDFIFSGILSVNEKLDQKVGKYAANLIDGLVHDLKKDTRSETEKSQIEAYLSRIVQKFPDRITAEILKNRKLAQTLGLKRMSLISIQDKQISAQIFWRGIGKALENGSVVLKTSDKKSIGLNLLPEYNALPTFKLGDEDNILLADDLFSFLVSKKADIRQAIKANTDWFEFPKIKQKQLEKMIIHTKDYYKRAEIIERIREAAPAYRYAKLEKHLEERSSFDWDELSPAPVERLLCHLHLRDSKTKNINAKINQAAKLLIKQHGHERTFRYFSGLPYYLPKAIVNTFLGLENEEQNKSLQTIFDFCYSPTRLFHFLYLLRKTKRSPQRLKVFGKAIERLEQYGEQLCEAHLFVLKYAENIFTHDKKWLSLSGQERLLLCWYHADQITNLLIGHGMPLKDFTKQFQQKNIGVSYHFLLTDRAYRICPYAPSNVRTSRLFFAGLAMGLGEDYQRLLSKKQQEFFKNHFLIGQDDPLLPDPIIIQDNRTYTPSIKSFLTDNLYEFGMAIGGQEFAHQFKPESADELVHKCKDKIIENAQDLNSWFHFAIFFQPGLIPESEQEIVRKAPDIDFYSLLKNGEQLAPVILRYLGESLQFSEDTELCDKFKHSLYKVIKKLAAGYTAPIMTVSYNEESEDAWIKNAAMFLSDVLMVMNRQDTLENALKALSQTAVEICQLWPSLAPIWRNMLNIMIKDLSFKDAAVLWEAQTKLRTFL